MCVCVYQECSADCLCSLQGLGKIKVWEFQPLKDEMRPLDDKKTLGYFFGMGVGVNILTTSFFITANVQMDIIIGSLALSPMSLCNHM